MSTEEYRAGLGVPELDQTQAEVSEETRRALAHPTLQEARNEPYMLSCAD